MRRVAVISNEPSFQEPMRFRGKLETIRGMVDIQLREMGAEPRIFRPIDDKTDFPDIRKFSALIVGGSKLNITDQDLKKYEWMRMLFDFISDSHGKIPILGLCFGHQAVGRVLGGKLEKYEGYEVGFTGTRKIGNDPLLDGIPPVFDALYSHFTYITGISPIALSTDPQNRSVQAFNSGTTWGVQFHPEYESAAVLDLVNARREAIEHLIDFDSVRSRLQSVTERHDIRVLSNFIRMI